MAAEPKVVDEISLTKYRNDNGNGLIAQLVEQRTFNRDEPATADDSREVTKSENDPGEPSPLLQPHRAAATAASISDPRKASADPVEAALAVGIEAIAGSMAKANPTDLVTLASRMSELARELEARRLARTKVVDLSVERERRR